MYTYIHIKRRVMHFLAANLYIHAGNKQDHGTTNGGVRWEGNRDEEGYGWPILIWTPPQAVVRPIWEGVPTTLCQPTTPLHLIAIACQESPIPLLCHVRPLGPSLPLAQVERRWAVSSRSIDSYNSPHRFFVIGLCYRATTSSSSYCDVAHHWSLSVAIRIDQR